MTEVWLDESSGILETILVSWKGRLPNQLPSIAGDEAARTSVGEGRCGGRGALAYPHIHIGHLVCDFYYIARIRIRENRNAESLGEG